MIHLINVILILCLDTAQPLIYKKAVIRQFKPYNPGSEVSTNMPVFKPKFCSRLVVR